VLALYILTLSLSGGLVGVFIRQVLGTVGLVHGFRGELMLAGVVASAYICVELLYVALSRLLKPTRSGWPLLVESISHLGALALVPYLVSIEVPWPHPLLIKFEALIYLGAFGVWHCFFKLMSFYATIRSQPSSRFFALFWLLAGGLGGLATYAGLMTWAEEMEQARPQVSKSVSFYRIGDEYGGARELPEGAAIAQAASTLPNPCLTLRWANLPETELEAPLDRIYVTITLEGDQKVQRSTWVPLNETGWTELGVSSQYIPSGLRTYSVVWTVDAPPTWRRILGIGPVVTSERRVLLSGPFEHEARGEDTEPNILLILVEGLGADRVSGFGYKRETTPRLDGLAKESQVFLNAYTPAPEMMAAGMTVITGFNPLRHGYLGRRNGPLPAGIETLAEILSRRRYVTAAFTEGENIETKDLVFGSGFERGFEVFNASCPHTEGEAGISVRSGMTLDKATSWIESRTDKKYFVFVRLRELRNPLWCERYAPGFVGNSAALSPEDIHDSALAYLDREIGDLLRRVCSGDSGKNTCVIVTSPYGREFSRGGDLPALPGMTETCLRVPLWLRIPGMAASERPDPVALEDLLPTVLSVIRADEAHYGTGTDLLGPTRDRRPISMGGNPLVLSARMDQWRFSWQSGLAPFTTQAVSKDSAVDLFDVTLEKERGYRVNEIGKYPRSERLYREHLQTYLREQNRLRLADEKASSNAE